MDTASISTEIDSWLANRRFTGNGLETEVIKLLCSYLYLSL